MSAQHYRVSSVSTPRTPAQPATATPAAANAGYTPSTASQQALPVQPGSLPPMHPSVRARVQTVICALETEDMNHNLWALQQLALALQGRSDSGYEVAPLVSGNVPLDEVFVEALVPTLYVLSEFLIQYLSSYASSIATMDPHHAAHEKANGAAFVLYRIYGHERMFAEHIEQQMLLAHNDDYDSACLANAQRIEMLSDIALSTSPNIDYEIKRSAADVMISIMHAGSLGNRHALKTNLPVRVWHAWTQHVAHFLRNSPFVDPAPKSLAWLSTCLAFFRSALANPTMREDAFAHAHNQHVGTWTDFTFFLFGRFFPAALSESATFVKEFFEARRRPPLSKMMLHSTRAEVARSELRCDILHTLFYVLHAEQVHVASMVTVPSSRSPLMYFSVWVRARSNLRSILEVLFSLFVEVAPPRSMLRDRLAVQRPGTERYEVARRIAKIMEHLCMHYARCYAAGGVDADGVRVDTDLLADFATRFYQYACECTEVIALMPVLPHVYRVVSVLRERPGEWRRWSEFVEHLKIPDTLDCWEFQRLANVSVPDLIVVENRAGGHRDRTEMTPHVMLPKEKVREAHYFMIMLPIADSLSTAAQTLKRIYEPDLFRAVTTPSSSTAAAESSVVS